MSVDAKAFGRNDPVGFEDIPGFVVLLDAKMNETVPRQDCTFSWTLIHGGASFSVSTKHAFEIQGKAITYMAIGSENQLLFVSIVAGHPVEHGANMVIG